MRFDLQKEAIIKNYAFNNMKDNIYEVGQNKVTRYSVNWQILKITQGESVSFGSRCPKTAIENF